MSDAETTLILSDLHLGGGPNDPGEDHIHQGAPLARLITEQTASPDGQAGRLELFFNGDFLEFAQTNQDAYSLRDDSAWCTESQSLAKLETILAGHAPVFQALAQFLLAGNRVTLAAGNHDVDLAWPQVQHRLRQVVGPALQFEIGQTWVTRHGGLLQIGHGHQQDVANRFEHWDEPIRHGAGELPHLEMCPGTLFMVKFVNRLEARYPFADNLLPVTKLLPVLLGEDRRGLASVAWLFMKLLATTSGSTLSAQRADDLGAALLQRVRDDAAYRADIGQALGAAGQADLQQRWAAGPWKEKLLLQVMQALLGRLDDDGWDRLFTAPPSAVLAADDDDGVTLNALRKAAFEDGKQLLRDTARQRAKATGAQVVVMGHTHQPDEVRDPSLHYLNPGSWTRYLELAPGQKVRLADLKDESRYPYVLNVVRVRQVAGALQARMVCVERGGPATAPGPGAPDTNGA